MADQITEEKRLMVRLWSTRLENNILKEEVAALRAADIRAVIADWMIAHGYTWADREDTVDTLLSELVDAVRRDEADSIRAHISEHGSYD